ncbi:MAG: hypothetical protein R2695_14065 [Acidimicrobiales bacterium]
MLRASIPTPRQLDPRPIVSGIGDAGVEHGAALIAFTDAVVLADEYELPIARDALVERMGVAATHRAALVAGNFSMMNRVLDAIGAPVDPGFAPLATEMGLVIPGHLLSR